MLLLMVISLYTSRVIFITLGVIDYGIYDLVGGVIILFSFFDVALSNATMRFLSYELGNKNFDKLRKTFCMSVNVHLFLALIVLIIGETIGLWFFNTQLNIPSERMIAARWAYQFSIGTFIFKVLKVPFHSLLLANEEMSFYALLSIIEGVLKLLIVFMLNLFKIDKLVLYGFLTLLISFVVLLAFYIYCYIKFPTTRFKILWDKSLFKALVNFSGWSMLESVSRTSSSQGSVVLLNVYFGVTLNAVMGIANRVGSAVNEFVWNFHRAFKPQILKSYSTADQKSYYLLIVRTSKLSYYLLYVISLPILFYTKEILELWLKSVPHYSTKFTQIALIVALIEAISGPLWVIVHATGEIKRYQLGMSLIIFSNLWLSWILLAFGLSPTVIMQVKVLTTFGCFLYQIFYLNKYVGFDTKSFVKDVILNIIIVVIITTIVFKFTLPLLSNFHFLINIIVVLIVNSLIIVALGLSKEEKIFVFSLLKSNLKFLNKDKK